MVLIEPASTSFPLKDTMLARKCVAFSSMVVACASVAASLEVCIQCLYNLGHSGLFFSCVLIRYVHYQLQ